MMNVLITGGTGFIGRYLVETLSTQYKVFVLARKDIYSSLQVTTIIADLTDSNFTKQLPSNIDCVIHLAQSNKYREFPQGVSDMYRVNITATLELLEWSRINKVKNFLYTSSANVYSSSNSPLFENSQCLPTSFYGASKLAAEHLIMQYQSFFQTDILRCFTVYGPNQQHMLISNMIDRIKNGVEITLTKGVGLYLTPLFVGDLINIIKKIIILPATSECRILNACGDSGMSLSEIINILQTRLGKSALIKHTEGEPLHFIGSNAKIKNLLGNLEFTSPYDGLHLTLSNQIERVI